MLLLIITQSTETLKKMFPKTSLMCQTPFVQKEQVAALFMREKLGNIVNVLVSSSMEKGQRLFHETEHGTV